MLRTKANNWLFFNRACYLCGLSFKPQSTGLRAQICPGCREDLPAINYGCFGCGLPLSPERAFCDACLKHPPKLDSVWARFVYRFPLGALLHRIKKSGDASALHFLTSEMADHAPIDTLTANSRLVPVPMHPWDRLQRGFNQTDLIAAQLAKILGVTWESELLHKVARTRHQAELHKQQRLHNLEQAFTLSGSPPEHVVLIDDVMTTGATLERCAEALYRGGCQQVDAWVLCRTPPPAERRQ